MDEERHGRLPLLPTLDRLDTMMKYFERKHTASRWNDGVISSPIAAERRRLPLDLALQEAHAKGSVLDRVAVLEHRLTQLSLEMETSSISSSSTVRTLGSATRRQEPSSSPHFFSCQSFDEPILHHHQENNQHHHETKSAAVREQIANNLQATDHPQKSKKKKQRSRKSWRCKRLLGC